MPLTFSDTLRLSPEQVSEFSDWLEQSRATASDPEFSFEPETSMTCVEYLPGPFAIIARKHGEFQNSAISFKVVTERQTPANLDIDRK
ncbi:hypothetical protein Q9L58_008273 [Maublancomyces gigas]|uniref:Uncharacterized protein n=1 Tax=Discina gigas TaxID=1032678 RepID=A0ABR3GAN6_9PEZI